MLRIILIGLLFCLNVFTTEAQSIPAFGGTTAENKQINIPSASLGKYALLCFASSKKAQADLETWLDPVYNRYIATTGFMDDMFDVDVFFIPVFGGGEGAIQSTVNRNVSESAHADRCAHLFFADRILKTI